VCDSSVHMPFAPYFECDQPVITIDNVRENYPIECSSRHVFRDKGHVQDQLSTLSANVRLILRGLVEHSQSPCINEFLNDVNTT